MTCNEHYIVGSVKKGMENMNNHPVPDRKKEILETTWNYLLKKGLTHASIGELCRETKLAQSSLYYWFDNKDDVWVSAGKFGLSRVVDALFAYTLNHTNEVQLYFDTLLDEVEKYKYDLRLAVQLTSGPTFGDSMRAESMNFRLLYEQFAHKLIDVFGCSHQLAEIFIYTIIALVIDYVLWDDREKTQMLLDNLCQRVFKALNIN